MVQDFQTIDQFIKELLAMNITIELNDRDLKIGAPKGVVTPAIIDEISKRKPDILNFLLEKERRKKITKIPDQTSYISSHAQLRLWTLSQLNDASTAYNVFSVHEMIGKIRPDLIEASFREIIERHEILRTNFSFQNDELRQIVRPASDIRYRLENTDLSGQSNWKQALDELLKQETEFVFDLASDLLIRTSLIILPDSRHLFVFNVHHMVGDGWSVDVLINEFITIYYALLMETSPQLPHVEIQYRDFALWKHQYLRSEDAKQDQEYWLGLFQVPPEPIKFPTIKERPKQKTFNGSSHRLILSREELEGLDRIRQENDCTLNMVLMTIMNVLLHKYTGLNDLVVGMTSTGRGVSQLDDQLGFYVNTLPIRSNLQSNEDFRTTLLATRKRIVEALEHEDYPFDMLVDALDFEFDISRSPLFDILIEIHNYGKNISVDGHQSLGVLELLSYSYQKETSIFDMDLEFFVYDDSLILDIEYNTDVFELNEIEKFGERFRHLVKQVIEDSSKSIAIYDIILPEDRSFYNKINATEVETDIDHFLPLFEATCRQQPQKVALSQDGVELTYQEVDALSNKLAGFLSRKGVHDEEIIGIQMDRSPAFIWSILGIWKAGCAYLPIDPQMPLDRTKGILEDTGISKLIVGDQYVQMAMELQWQCLLLNNIISVSSNDISKIEAPYNESMKKNLWHYVGEQARDDIEGGGWINSYTGLPISRDEMDEYAQNTYEKLLPYLNPSSKVLEIGCASGITMFKLAPLVGEYIGTDLSSVILEKNTQRIREEGFENIRQYPLYAHEIDELGEEDVDVIIINSVIQNFHGYNYLREVIGKCIDSLSDNGIIYLGDIMDLSNKGQMIESLRSFHDNHQGTYKTKLEWNDELFVSKGLLEDLATDFPSIVNVEHSRKRGTIENELTQFRFDTILTLSKKGVDGTRKKHKQQYDLRDILNEPESFKPEPYGGDRLAYVIYTSGSTGIPKGVMVEHGGMVNHLLAKVDDLELDREAIVAQNASQSFDISIWQMVVALLSGGTTCVYDKNLQLNVHQFVAALARDRITILEVVPSYLLVLLDFLAANQDGLKYFESVRYLMVTGEPVSATLVRKWYALFPHIPVVNAYGPTEASDDITHEYIESDITGNVPVGKPVRNTQLVLVDKDQQMVPPDIYGEVCVTGHGVGRGYLNNPIKTDGAFNDAFLGGDKRAYKTGDLGRFLPNGKLQVSGRSDYQVKIRGHRIELGDVENALRKVSLVKEAVVLVDGDENDKELKAYIIPEGDLQETEGITLELSKLLPPYMIPGSFVLYEVFPTTSSGKIDRKALAKFTVSGNAKSAEPTTSLERELLDLWKEVLEKEHIGVSDNFFKSGGHSLKATRLVSKINSLIDDSFRLKDVFEFNTIKAQAEILQTRNRNPLDDIKPVPVADRYLTSSAQKRLWTLSKINTKNFAYNELVAYHWTGALELELFENALISLVERHESLRTTFFMDEDGHLFQKVVEDPASGFNLDRYNQNNQSNADQWVDFHMMEIQGTTMDLENGPLIRVRILTHRKHDHTIIFCVHHIISDGWSDVILLRDFTKFYNALATDQPHGLEPLKIQHKDYCHWQSNQIETEDFRLQRDFWKAQLEGDQTPIQWPGTHTRPTLLTNNGDSIIYSFSKEISDILRRFAEQNDVSLFTTLLSLVYLIAYRSTGKEELTFGTSFANRNHALLEDQMGFFLNVLPLKFKIDSSESVQSLTKRVGALVNDCLVHASFPFNEMASNFLNLKDPAHSAFFDILVEFQSFESLMTKEEKEYHVIDQVELKPVSTRNTLTKYDLNFSFFEREQIELLLTFNTDIYPQSVVQDLLDRLSFLAGQLKVGALELVKDIPVISPGELQLIEELNDNLKGEVQQSFVEAFEAQVQATPDRMAATDHTTEATYEALNCEANQYAHQLLIAGITKEEPVVVIAHRSIEFLAAMIGILKVGGAYLPLDVAAPEERLAIILKDSKAKYLILGSSFQTEWEQILSRQLKNINIINLGQGSVASVHDNPGITIGKNQLAYVLYTSGSTGLPKGALIEHLGLMNHLLAMGEEFGLDQESILAQNAPQTFDVSIWQFLAPLIYGGQCQIYEMEELADVTGFLASVGSKGVSHLEVVPSYLALMLEVLESSDDKQPLSLHYLLSIGEKLPASLVSRWYDIYPEIPIINAYGPTEASDSITHYQVPKQCSGVEVPIGKCIRNSKIYILDSWQQLCPIGIIGELFVTGDCVGRGYLNQPKRTAEVFIDHPEFGRGYLTGDLGRMDKGGIFYFHGRRDSQVKINGQRAELGEIQFHLNNIEGVQMAAVKLLTHRDQQFLVAYLQSDEEPAQLKNRVQLELRKVLTQTLMPKYFKILSSFPLTSSGKIDYQKLPVPDKSVKSSAEVVPSNKEQNLLIHALKEALAVESVSLRDSFFDLGGDSMTAIRIISLLKKQHWSVTLEDIFKHQRVDEIAKHMQPIEESSDQQVTSEEAIGDFNEDISLNDLNKLNELFN